MPNADGGTLEHVNTGAKHPLTALLIAIAVVVGGALGLLVKAVVDDFIMPIVGAITPSGNWRAATWTVGSVRFGVGDFLSNLLNFFIIGFVAWRIAKVFIKSEPEAAKPAAKPAAQPAKK